MPITLAEDNFLHELKKIPDVDRRDIMTIGEFEKDYSEMLGDDDAWVYWACQYDRKFYRGGYVDDQRPEWATHVLIVTK